MDCSLIEQRPKQGGGNLTRRSDVNEPPSVTMQTDWPSGSFDFSKSKLPLQPGVDYFNCGLVARPDGDFLIVRRSRNHPGMPWGVNDLAAFKLDGVTPTEGEPVKLAAQHDGEHFEDPRAVWQDGRVWISCTNFVWGQRWTGAHQILCEIDDRWRSTIRHDPVYANNGAHVWGNKGQEKNWLWFWHDGRPHMIYLTQPLVILEWDQAFTKYREFINRRTAQKDIWFHGQMRGGTPPVRVGEEYWTFFHSSLSDKCSGGRRYYMGAMAFEAKGPFTITRISKKPILTGSAEDRTGYGKPLVVFPCGSVLKKEKWLVSFGVNDLEAGWIVIPHADLLTETRAI